MASISNSADNSSLLALNKATTSIDTKSVTVPVSTTAPAALSSDASQASTSVFSKDESTTAVDSKESNINSVFDSDKKEVKQLEAQKAEEQKVEAEAKKAEADKAEAKKEESKTSEKTGESVDERLTRYYSKYKNASRAEKEKLFEKYVTQHFASLKGKTRQEQINIQLADYKKLLSNTKDGDDYEMMAKEISILEKENQVLAAKAATKGAPSAELRRRGEIGVAHSVPKCHSENQVELTKIVVDSKNDEAIEIGASHAAECNKENQVEIVKTYQSIDKVEVNKILIDQYGQYHKDNQVDIHRTMSGSKHTETVEYAASNIWHFHKDNQAPAVTITTETGNEAAIKAAAAQFGRYDKSVQDEIKSIIYSTGCESAIEALEAAEQLAQAEQAAKEEAEALQASKAGSSQKQTLAEEFKKLANSNSMGRNSSIRNLFKRASESEKIAMLSSLSPSELMSVLGVILQENLPMSVLSKIMLLLDKVDGNNKDGLFKKMQNSLVSGFIKSNMGFLGRSLQKFIIKESSKNNTLASVNRTYLDGSLKTEYDKLKKEQENRVA